MKKDLFKLIEKSPASNAGDSGIECKYNTIYSNSQRNDTFLHSQLYADDDLQ